MKVKVRATSKYQKTNINDSELTAQDKENKRIVPEEGKEWTTERERAEMLQEKGFVTIVEEIKEEITEEVVQAVAKGIVEEAKEQDKTVENIVDEIIEESEEEVVGEKPKKTTKKRTTTKK